jgi:hypothetical protein
MGDRRGWEYNKIRSKRSQDGRNAPPRGSSQARPIDPIPMPIIPRAPLDPRVVRRQALLPTPQQINPQQRRLSHQLDQPQGSVRPSAIDHRRNTDESSNSSYQSFRSDGYADKAPQKVYQVPPQKAPLTTQPQRNQPFPPQSQSTSQPPFRRAPSQARPPMPQNQQQSSLPTQYVQQPQPMPQRQPSSQRPQQLTTTQRGQSTNQPPMPQLVTQRQSAQPLVNHPSREPTTSTANPMAPRANANKRGITPSRPSTSQQGVTTDPRGKSPASAMPRGNANLTRQRTPGKRATTPARTTEAPPPKKSKREIEKPKELVGRGMDVTMFSADGFNLYQTERDKWFKRMNALFKTAEKKSNKFCNS